VKSPTSGSPANHLTVNNHYFPLVRVNPNSNFRINFANKPLFRFIPRLSILPDLLLRDQEKKELFDPIGNQPFLLADLADEGANIVSVPVNPLDRLILECLFDPPPQNLGNNWLSKFFNLRVGEQRLDQHIHSLFYSTCQSCGKAIEVNFFVRDGTNNELIGKSYHCDCGLSGTQPVNDQDRLLDENWRRSDGLYRTRVTGLFAGLNGISDQDILDVLTIYSPKALYAIELISQKIIQSVDKNQQKYYLLALVYIADSINSLWNISNQIELPKLIYRPKRMIEFNFWTAIEESANLLNELAKFTPRIHESSHSDGFASGITVNKWVRLKDKQPMPPTSIVAVVPRPNQAYWSLSALWSRWLLNLPRDEVFLRSIARKKVDWDWFYEASAALMRRVAGIAESKPPINFILSENEPDYIASFMFAMNNENVWLEEYSIQTLSNSLVLRCRIGKPVTVYTNETVSRSKPDYLKQVVDQYLTTKGSPVPYEILLTDLLCLLSLDRDYVFQKKKHKLFLKKLNELLTSSEYEDIEGRNTPQTGTWKIRAKGFQQPLL